MYWHAVVIKEWRDIAQDFRLSNISIKTNFKQITSVELKCAQCSEGDYILCMTSPYFFRSFSNVRLLCTMYLIGIYLPLCTFSFEINKSRLSNTRCLIQVVVSPHTVVINEWRDVARDVLCRTTLTWRHTIGRFTLPVHSLKNYGPLNSQTTGKGEK
jgi:hypothetical protein